MASLRVFARRIRALGGRVEKNAGRKVVRAAVAINQAVVLSTPVDTGRARANWRVGLGDPVRLVREETDQGGLGTIGENNARIRQRRPGQDVYISNNVEYIQFLNEGSSAQAPAGFVERAVAVGRSAARLTRITE